MTRTRRTFATGLLAAALVLALVGTGGFTSATADRKLAVETATDERAYVGYDSPDAMGVAVDEDGPNGSEQNETNTNGSETMTLVTLTNRFTVAVDVTDVDIEAKPDALNVTVRPPPSDVSPGESRAVVAELECEDTFEDRQLSVTVRLRGDGVEAVVFGDTQSRTISVTCRTGA